MMRPWTNFCQTAATLSLAVLALALAGCAAEAPPYRPSAPTFAGAPVWRVAADRVEVQEADDLKPTEPPVLARLAADPKDVARAWPKARFRTDPASRGLIVYRIDRAEAVERYLPRKTGVTAAFTKNPEAEFTVAFAVTVTALGSDGAERGTARAEASATSTLNEGTDEDERRRIWERLMRNAAAKLDAELQKQVPVGLKSIIRPN